MIPADECMNQLCTVQSIVRLSGASRLQPLSSEMKITRNKNFSRKRKKIKRIVEKDVESAT